MAEHVLRATVLLIRMVKLPLELDLIGVPQAQSTRFMSTPETIRRIRLQVKLIQASPKARRILIWQGSVIQIRQDRI